MYVSYVSGCFQSCFIRRISSLISVDMQLGVRYFILSSLFNQSVNLRTGQDVDDLVMGMASQIAERTDNVVVEDLRGL